MSEYRKEVTNTLRETRWTFFKGFPLFVVILVVLSATFFGLNSLGLIGKTAVEREVFEQSYQRSSALQAQIATDEATIASIQRKLNNPGLDKNTRFNLEAQLSAAQIRIETARRQQ